jgi:hypothetical protein
MFWEQKKNADRLLIEIFEPRPMLQVQEFCWIGSLGD